MKPTSIISLKNQLKQFFNSDFLLNTAKRCGFIKRQRVVKPLSFVLSLIAALSKGNCHAIADLHRQFNGMSLNEKDGLSYQPFHNQLRKKGFPLFMKELVKFAMGQFIQDSMHAMPTKLACFDDVLLIRWKLFSCA